MSEWKQLCLVTWELNNYVMKYKWMSKVINMNEWKQLCLLNMKTKQICDEI